MGLCSGPRWWPIWPFIENVLNLLYTYICLKNINAWFMKPSIQTVKLIARKLGFRPLFEENITI